MPSFIRSRTFWIVIVVAAVLGGGLVTLSNVKAAQQKAAAAKAAKAPPSPYVAIASGKADVEGGVIAVAARTAGIVRAVYVQEGDHVTPGQVLARQEDDAPRLAAQTAAADLGQARAAIAATQVQLRTAEREYHRLQALQASNFVAGQRLDQARDNIAAAQATLDAQRASVDAAAARLAQARYQQELTVIRAPAEGRIARRYANPGAGASTLNVSTMFDLEPAAPHIVRAEVTEAAVPAVAIGQSVELAAESEPGKVFKGRVMRRAAVFGARKLQSDDPAERTDDRVVEVVVSADGAPFIIGQRVLVKFMKGGVALAQQ
jgi:RND family efflux transporter MFP subunit